jgi:hypothetical protein
MQDPSEDEDEVQAPRPFPPPRRSCSPRRPRSRRTAVAWASVPVSAPVSRSASRRSEAAWAKASSAAARSRAWPATRRPAATSGRRCSSDGLPGVARHLRVRDLVPPLEQARLIDGRAGARLLRWMRAASLWGAVPREANMRYLPSSSCGCPKKGPEATTKIVGWHVENAATGFACYYPPDFCADGRGREDQGARGDARRDEEPVARQAR